MKYIIVEDMGLEQPIVFSDLLTHRQVSGGDLDKVVSAGFCSCSNGGVWRCWGESVSLSKKSRGTFDEEILLQRLQ